MSAMRAYNWPGNVRELRNRLVRAVSFGKSGKLGVADLFPDIRINEALGSPRATLEEARSKAERHRIVEALATHDGRIADTAHSLGISRVTLLGEDEKARAIKLRLRLRRSGAAGPVLPRSLARLGAAVSHRSSLHPRCGFLTGVDIAAASWQAQIASTGCQSFLGRNPRCRSSGGMVNPWMTIENTTTPNVVTTMASRNGTTTGSDSASDNARAPRNPPHQSTCCSATEIAQRERVNSAQSG